MRRSVVLSFLLACFALVGPAGAQSGGDGTVVFWETGFPAADTVSPSSAQLTRLLPEAKTVGALDLREALAGHSVRLLVLPFGSAFPEESWTAIKGFLDRGGNLLVLGGRPFTRAAYHDSKGWHLRDYSVRFIRPLMIDQYQETPGSEGLQFVKNPEVPLDVPSFTWTRAFSPVIRLSAVDLYHRGGAAGSLDARLDTIAWGVKEGRKLSAPLIEVDHDRNGFDGGRWIFVNAELTQDFFDKAELIKSLVQRASRGAEEFTVRPVLPLYLPGEPLEVKVQWYGGQTTPGLSVKIAIYPESQASNRIEVTRAIPANAPIVLPSPSGKGTLSRPNCWKANGFGQSITPDFGFAMRGIYALDIV